MSSDTSIISEAFIEVELNGETFLFWGDSILKFEQFLTVTSYGNSAYFKLVDSSHESLEASLENASTINFRHGYKNSRATSWKKYYVDGYVSSFLGSRSTLDLFLIEAPPGLTGNEKNRSFKNMSVSEIFEKIISDYNLKSVIEPTKGKFTLRQHNITDDRFIIEWLLPRATPQDKDKFGDYNYYGVDGKEVHFHPIDTRLKEFKTYNGYQDSAHPLTSFKYYSGYASYNYQSARLNVLGYDPIEKKQLEFNIDNNSLNGKQIKFAPKVESVSEDPNGTGKYFRTPFKNIAEVDNLGNQIWRFQNTRAYSAHATMASDPDLEPGKIIEIVLKDEKSGYVLKKSGKYQVDSILFKYNGKKYNMLCILVRNSSGFGTSKTDGSKINNTAKTSKYISNTVLYDEGSKTVKRSVSSV